MTVVNTDAKVNGTMQRYFIATVSLAAVVGIVFLFLYEARVLTCNPGVLSDEWYIAYCEPLEAFHDHPAMLFNIDGVLDGAKNTDVLIMGNSTTQMAFSNVESKSFFERINANFFLLGFGYAEGWEFPTLIATLNRLDPRVVVINTSGGWLTTEMSPRATSIVRHPLEAYLRSRIHALYQSLQRRYCADGAVHPFCFRHMTVVHRSRKNGTWMAGPDGRYDAPPKIRYGCEISEPGPNVCGNKMHRVSVRKTTYPVHTPFAKRRFRRYRYLVPSELVAAETFIGKFNLARECVVITATPISSTEVNRARELAARVGATFVDVDKSGLYTLDQSHLFIHSAELYSKRFFAAIAPLIERCRRGSAGSGART